MSTAVRRNLQAHRVGFIHSGAIGLSRRGGPA